MSLASILKGRIRGVVAAYFAEGDEQQTLQMNNRSDLVVTQALPELTELVRLGDSWQVATVTAFAALTTEPSTAAALSIFNNEPATGKSYAIDSVVMWERVVDVTQQNEMAVFANLQQAASATVKPTATASVTPRGLSGKTYGGSAICAAGAATVNDGWFPHGSSAPGAAAVAGGIWRVTEVPLRGLYYVKPQGMFSVHAVKAAATASQLQAVIRWHEVKLAYF